VVGEEAVLAKERRWLKAIKEQCAFYRKHDVIGRYAPALGNKSHIIGIRQARTVIKILKWNELTISTWCEVGVWFANVTCALMPRWPIEKAVLVDTWRPYAQQRPEMPPNIDKTRFTTQELHDEIFACVASAVAKFGDKIVLVRADSAAFGELLGPDRFDVVFIDADHTYEPVKRDIELYWPTVKKGGLLLGDNYDTPRTAPYWGVKRAVDEMFGDRVQRHRRFWWLKK
jgi:hypothetical protein